MDFSEINKKASESFHQQRNILKKLAQGRTIKCEVCNMPLNLNLNTNKADKGHVNCKKGCTDIMLELGN
jgi:hypothetical protein